jgi:hypothetical protein
VTFPILCPRLEAKCVQKYRFDANDVQKYYLLRDRWATRCSFATQAAIGVTTHWALIGSSLYSLPPNIRDNIVNSQEVAASFMISGKETLHFWV